MLQATRTGGPPGDGFLLGTSPPTRAQVRLAGGVLVVLVAALLVTAPFAKHMLADSEPLLPAYAAALLVNELTTSALLLALFSLQRSRAVLLLAVGYLFSGLMVVPWVATFPGVFTAYDLDAGLQATSTIAALRRLGFPLFVLLYALLKDRQPRAAPGSVPRAILASVLGVVAFVCGIAWLVVLSSADLPRFMRDTSNVTVNWQYVSGLAILLYVVGLAALWLRRRSILDLWLMVVLCALLIELLLLSYISAGIRLSVGWWAGRLYGLASASVVLVVLLSEMTALHARLARSVSAERRARENRLTAMEALSASIAHEVNQPLASMVTNADAGLHWLENESPDLEEVRAALKRIVRDGHRAGAVIKGIRTMFMKGAQERVLLNLNPLIDEVLRRVGDEARLGRVAVQAELGRDLPPVSGNPVQLQQVLSNLIANAIDAMGAVTARPRLLRVTSELGERGDLLVSVADTGPGVEPERKERIFEPFVTTKADGMGMGLMFCRAIVEAHGGRLWVVDNPPHGAIFHFTLPSNHERRGPAGDR